MSAMELVKQEKETYERPTLAVVDLASEEVLATGCKFAGSPTTNVGAPQCGIASCVLDGS